MSVSAANPCATPGGMNTPTWLSPRRGRAAAWRRRSGRPRGGRAARPGPRRTGRTSSRPGAGGSAARRARPAWRFAAVALHHLAPVREPLAPVRLDEQPTLVTVDLRLDDPHAGDRRRSRVTFGHRLLDVDLAVVADHQPQRPRLGPACATSTASLPIRLSSSRWMSMHRAALHHHRVLDLAVTHLAPRRRSHVNGPMKLFSTIACRRR